MNDQVTKNDFHSHWAETYPGFWYDNKKCSKDLCREKPECTTHDELAKALDRSDFSESSKLIRIIITGKSSMNNVADGKLNLSLGLLVDPVKKEMHVIPFKGGFVVSLKKHSIEYPENSHKFPGHGSRLTKTKANIWMAELLTTDKWLKGTLIIREFKDKKNAYDAVFDGSYGHRMVYGEGRVSNDIDWEHFLQE